MRESTRKYLSKFIVFPIRLLPEEKKLLDQYAAEEGKSLAQYCKDKVLKRG